MHLSCTGFGGSKQSRLKLNQICRSSVSSRRTWSLTSVKVRLRCFWQRRNNRQRSWTLESEANNKAPQKNDRTSDTGEAFPPIWQYLSMKIPLKTTNTGFICVAAFCCDGGSAVEWRVVPVWVQMTLCQTFEQQHGNGQSLHLLCVFFGSGPCGTSAISWQC